MKRSRRFLPNQDIRLMIRKYGFTQPQVAQEMGISLSYFTKLLMIPLKPKMRKRAVIAIGRLKRERVKEELAILNQYENQD